MDGLLEFFLLLAMAVAIWLLLRPALPRFRERLGSWRVHRALLRSLPASHYSVFRDVTVCANRAEDRPRAQIGHVVVSPYGLFIIEARHLSGRIDGSENDALWTRCHFRSKQQFHNPLGQARDHVLALRDLTGLSASRFQCMAVFTGRVDFERPMPARVTQLGGLVPFIQVRTQELLGFEEAQRIAALLESSRVPPGIQTAAAHLLALRESHGSRLSARQAMLGLGLMAALLVAAGSLVHRLGEKPGQFPSAASGQGGSPFITDAPPPRIALPGVTGPHQSADATSRAAVIEAVAPGRPAAVRRQQERGQAANDKRLAWESSLMCAYATESQRCACYDQQGRKVAMEYGSCKLLADRSGGTARP
jgi:hypothetical protein